VVTSLPFRNLETHEAVFTWMRRTSHATCGSIAAFQSPGFRSSHSGKRARRYRRTVTSLQ
jgi:hypothetical protein